MVPGENSSQAEESTSDVFRPPGNAVVRKIRQAASALALGVVLTVGTGCGTDAGKKPVPADTGGKGDPDGGPPPTPDAQPPRKDGAMPDSESKPDKAPVKPFKVTSYGLKGCTIKDVGGTKYNMCDAGKTYQGEFTYEGDLTDVDIEIGRAHV